MLKILITGANSYIGNSIREWLLRENTLYKVDELDMLNPTWEQYDFSVYDIVIHVAGIVHIRQKKDMWPLYYNVNTEMANKVAIKAKNEGVKHFIFFSTKGVYKPNEALLTKNISPEPRSFYGKSKLMAEEKLLKLADERFIVSVLRPPTVYGEGCKGNFLKLVKLSKKIHIFPRCRNKRSMIYIWNLCEYIRLLINDPCLKTDIHYPQNREYCGTLDILEAQWQIRGEKYFLAPISGFLLKFLVKMVRIKKFQTVFSDACYDLAMSNEYEYRYCLYSFKESMKKIIEESKKG